MITKERKTTFTDSNNNHTELLKVCLFATQKSEFLALPKRERIAYQQGIYVYLKTPFEMKRADNCNDW